MNIDEIRWYRCEKSTSSEAISKVEEELRIALPILYCNLMLQCDAGIPIQSDFEYYDEYHQSTISQDLGTFLGIENQESNILNRVKYPPEFFPKKLLAFAETGNGDYICFDYREGSENLDPTIVYWNHGADIGKDVSFVAKNFEEFLKMLKEPEEFP